MHDEQSYKKFCHSSLNAIYIIIIYIIILFVYLIRDINNEILYKIIISVAAFVPKLCRNYVYNGGETDSYNNIYCDPVTISPSLPHLHILIVA